jgi:hypothetical protein
MPQYAMIAIMLFELEVCLLASCDVQVCPATPRPLTPPARHALPKHAMIAVVLLELEVCLLASCHVQVCPATPRPPTPPVRTGPAVGCTAVLPSLQMTRKHRWRWKSMKVRA